MKIRFLFKESFRYQVILYLIFLLHVNVIYGQYTDNHAAVFNGSNSYVSVPNSSDLNATAAITVEAWVMPAALPTSMAVVGKNYLTGYYFGIESTGRFIFFPRGAGNFLRSRATGIVRLNQWAHIAATYDGTVTRLYLNGVLDTSTTSITGAVGSNSDSMFIGADRFSGSPAFFFNGRLDNVRIWKSARTTAEIAAHRYIPLEIPGLLNVPYSTIAASYQFDNNAIDNSGGMQEYGNERNVSYADYSDKAINYLDYNNSLVLNGTTSYARRGSYNSVYDPATNITLEAWIKRDTTGTQPTTQNVVNKSGGTTRYNYALFILSTGQIYFSISDGAYSIQSPALITNAQWTHLAAAYSQTTGKAVIYMNGDTVASGTFSGSPAIPSNNDSTFIGGIGATSYSANKFKGLIDEVRIWNKAARTQSQVREYMHKHYQATTADSLMHIDFDKFQNSFKLGNSFFHGSLLLRGSATISSSHNATDNRLSSPMLSDPDGEMLSAYTSGSKKFFVPDANASGITDSIFISGGPPVSNLKVYVLMSHTYTQDMNLTLTSPSGTSITLMNNKGGYDNDVMTIFSDAADSISSTGFSPTNGPGVTSPFSPEVKPDQPLSAFNGQSSSGWWKIKFADLAVSDRGFVHKWGINLLSKKTLNLTALIQGFYNAGSDKMISDTAQILLRIPLPPYPLLDSSKAVLDSMGYAKFYFNKVNNCYKIFKHRNSIETWSSSAAPFAGDTSSFDFTTAAANAFGGNQIQINSSPVRFAIYNGDVNQDGAIDLNDVIQTYNSAGIFKTGYTVTDINGDGTVDLNDVISAYNNSAAFVSAVKP